MRAYQGRVVADEIVSCTIEQRLVLSGEAGQLVGTPLVWCNNCVDFKPKHNAIEITFSLTPVPDRRRQVRLETVSFGSCALHATSALLPTMGCKQLCLSIIVPCFRNSRHPHVSLCQSSAPTTTNDDDERKTRSEAKIEKVI